MTFHSAPDHLRIGQLQTIPHDGGKTVTQDLVCCKHCGYIWSYAPGSGRTRGWCTLCNGLLCGRKCCRDKGCRTWQQMIDNIEQGKPEDYKPIVASVPGGVPGG